jgi:hypothetical protein
MKRHHCAKRQPPNTRLCYAAVVVLSPEFVRKAYPMGELKIFLERKASDPHSIVIIPVFIGLTVSQCYDLEALYDSEPWRTSTEIPPVRDRAVLRGWAEDVRELLKSTGAAIEQVRIAVQQLRACVAWWLLLAAASLCKGGGKLPRCVVAGLPPALSRCWHCSLPLLCNGLSWSCRSSECCRDAPGHHFCMWPDLHQYHPVLVRSDCTWVVVFQEHHPGLVRSDCTRAVVFQKHHPGLVRSDCSQAAVLSARHPRLPLKLGRPRCRPRALWGRWRRWWRMRWWSG